MYNGTNDITLSPSFRLHRSLLLLSCTTGLILGIAFSYAAEAFLPLMRGALVCPVSIVGLAALISLPLLITAFAVFTSRLWMLTVLAFCKAFLFGTCGACIGLAFSSAGWLIRMLLMFTDLALMPILICLWLRCLRGQKQDICRAMTVSAAVSILVGSIDYLVIAPFLASVI